MARKAWIARGHDSSHQRTDVSFHFFFPRLQELNGAVISSYVFREPVDPIILGIPQYHDIIPKKDARDLKTIRQKLDNDKFDTVEIFEADLDLMVSNAIKFNGAESDIGIVAIRIRDLYRKLLTEWKSNLSKKRKDGEQLTPQPAKKVKTG